MIRRIFQNKNVIIAAIIFLITTYSFFWQLGYKVFYQDQLIYLPILLKSLDPSLFAKDLIFSQEGYTLFGQLITGAMNFLHIGLIPALFVITFISRYIFFYSIYRLTLYFTGSGRFSIVSPFLVMTGFRVYGTNIFTMDSALLPRDIGTTLGLFSLSWLFYGNFFTASIFLSLGILIHPAMAIPFILFFYSQAFLFRRKQPMRLLSLIPLLLPILAGGWLYLNSPHLVGGLFSRFDTSWLTAVIDRTSYVFLSTWKYPNTSFLYLIVSIYMFFVVRKEIPEIRGNSTKNTFFNLLFLTPLFIAAVSFITVDILHMVIPAQLQLGRGFILWKIFFNLTFAYLGLKYVFQKPRNYFNNFLFLGIILSFIISEKVILIFLPVQMFMWFRERYRIFQNRFFKSRHLPWLGLVFIICILAYFAIIHKTGGFFFQSLLIIMSAGILSVFWGKYYHIANNFLSIKRIVLFFLIIAIAAGFPPFSFYPKLMLDKPFAEACEWIKDNTSKDAIFISEPFSREGSEAIRLLCLRGLFVTKKDGGQVLYGREYARAWQERYNLVNVLNNDTTLLPRIADTYDIDFLFSKSKLNIPYPLVFNNATYFIYRLNK